MREQKQSNSNNRAFILDIMFERTRHVSLNTIVSQINIHSSRALPHILLAVAPCRSGTTAQLRMFSALGIPSYYQPLKAILRRQAQGIEGTFNIPSDDIIFIKETLGPYSYAESIFNPLEVLLRAGYPKDKLTLIAEMREPLSTLTSWIQTELSMRQNREALLANFIAAYKTVLQIFQQAQTIGIGVIPYVYEAQRDTNPSFAAQRLFFQLDLPFIDLVATGWDTLPPFGTPESNIFFPVEPALYDGSYLDVATTSNELHYSKKTEQTIDEVLYAEEVEFVDQEDLSTLYEHIRDMVAKVLGLQVQVSTEVEQFKQRLAQRKV